MIKIILKLVLWRYISDGNWDKFRVLLSKNSCTNLFVSREFHGAQQWAESITNHDNDETWTQKPLTFGVKQN